MSRIGAFVRTARLLLALQVAAAAGAAALAFWAATHVSRLADERDALAVRVAELEAARPLPVEMLPMEDAAALPPEQRQQPAPDRVEPAAGPAPGEPVAGPPAPPRETTLPLAPADEPQPPTPTPTPAEETRTESRQPAQTARPPRLDARDAIPVIDRLLNRPRRTQQQPEEDAATASCVRQAIANGVPADTARARCAARQPQ